MCFVLHSAPPTKISSKKTLSSRIQKKMSTKDTESHKGLVDNPTLDHTAIFIEKHLQDVDSRFEQLQPVYSAKKGRFLDAESPDVVPIRETEEMRHQQRLFLDAVKKFERSESGTKSKVRWNSSSGLKWNDVIEELRRAEDRYGGVEHEGVLGRTRACLRTAKGLRAPCEQWLQLLPSESWQGSFLCGGMKMVLAAASTLDMMREEITDSIEQIPFTIQNALNVSGTYDSEAMQSHVSQLFVAALDLLQECLTWLRKNPIRKALSAFARGDDHSAALRQKQSQLRKLEVRIDKHAIVGLHKITKAMSERQGDVYGTLKGIEKDGQQQSITLNAMFEFIKEQVPSVQAIEEAQRLRNEAETAKIENEALRKSLRQAMDIQKEEILEEIQYDPITHTNDLLRSLDVTPDTYTKAQDRAAWMLNSGKLGAWISNQRSEVMIVNSLEPTAQRQSSVSLFSAMLVQALSKDDIGIVLYWSCGRHIHGSCEDVVKNLIGQLLQKGSKGLPLAALTSPLRKKRNVIDGILELTTCLMKEQLRQTSIFIIIDSVSFYEDRARLDLTRALFEQLYKLADGWKGTHHLKVMATSPTRCSFLGTLLDGWKPTVLSVPKVVSGERHRHANVALALVDERGHSDGSGAELTASESESDEQCDDSD